MSDTIVVKVKNMEPNDFKLHGVPVILREGDNTIKIEHWLALKKISSLNRKISRGHVSVDPNEELRATESFQKELFSEFEQLGIPAVKVSSEKGELSKGVKHSFALEWLSSKEESREESRDNREIETLSIDRTALKISKFAIVISIIALSVAIITLYGQQ